MRQSADRPALRDALAALGPGGLTVADVGARWGAAESWFRLKPLARLVGFEPDPAECARLNALADPAAERVHPTALGRHDGPGTLHVTTHAGCSSLYPPSEAALRAHPRLRSFMTVVDRVGVQLSRLDTWGRRGGRAAPRLPETRRAGRRTRRPRRGRVAPRRLRRRRGRGHVQPALRRPAPVRRRRPVPARPRVHVLGGSTASPTTRTTRRPTSAGRPRPRTTTTCPPRTRSAAAGCRGRTPSTSANRRTLADRRSLLSPSPRCWRPSATRTAAAARSPTASP